MDFVLTDIKKAGYSEVILWVFRDNLRARAFYEAKGFMLKGIAKQAFDTEEVLYSKMLHSPEKRNGSSGLTARRSASVERCKMAVTRD